MRPAIASRALFCAAWLSGLAFVGLRQLVLAASHGVSYDVRLIGVATVLMLLCSALVGISWYAKIQTTLIVTLGVAIVSVIVGVFLPSMPSRDENAVAGFVGIGHANTSLDLQLWPKFLADPSTGIV